MSTTGRGRAGGSEEDPPLLRTPAVEEGHREPRRPRARNCTANGAIGRALLARAQAQSGYQLDRARTWSVGSLAHVAPVLLESVLQLATTGLEKIARPLASCCPGCEQRRGVQSQRKRQVQTRLGPIRLERVASLLEVWTWLGPPHQPLGLAPYR
jgi:hypothetical protein